jgi:hypothetical protein
MLDISAAQLRMSWGRRSRKWQDGLGGSAQFSGYSQMMVKISCSELQQLANPVFRRE